MTKESKSEKACTDYKCRARNIKLLTSYIAIHLKYHKKRVSSLNFEDRENVLQLLLLASVHVICISVYNINLAKDGSARDYEF